ncbi:RNA-guided endonuclease InsQ/TnpB family protein [Saliphagus infecundisoli]|uniref:RNA-guided endonuclease InsQ/TnpB family protein n=1 Tax=Saliphagus infecundisoli TaxID=1849069 RepID=A0ABD5Q9B0_9EURY|nr:RNA-guided endonuclease TnpB family protein [Saliphagus infecundisoli]
MANGVVTRTYRACIRNQQQVSDDLDSLGFAASKLWNVGRWTAHRVWDACGQIPGANALLSYLKGHERYADLHSQSSQRVLQELAEAFTGWFGKRENGDTKANPPGYRKRNGEHPRSTVTFKTAGFKHDAENGRLRLSKGKNLKDGWSDFVLCEYDPIAPPGTTIENVQQVRAVYEHGEWRLHIVCRVESDVPESPGDRVAGIDLGICNFAAVSFGDESLLYPGGALKEDEYYFAKKRAETDDPGSRKARRLDRKRTARRTHFLHTLSKHIIGECVERGVGTVVIGDLGGIRDDENGESRNWGKHGNLDLHGWAFDRFGTLLEYKGRDRGIDVVRKDERRTSKTCSCCGTEDGSQRVERGLYACDDCGVVANADSNGAENIRQKVLPSPSPDRDNGWLAQPAVRLFDRGEGVFAPREQVTEREP